MQRAKQIEVRFKRDAAHDGEVDLWFFQSGEGLDQREKTFAFELVGDEEEEFVARAQVEAGAERVAIGLAPSGMEFVRVVAVGEEGDVRIGDGVMFDELLFDARGEGDQVTVLAVGIILAFAVEDVGVEGIQALGEAAGQIADRAGDFEPFGVDGLDPEDATGRAGDSEGGVGRGIGVRLGEAVAEHGGGMMAVGFQARDGAFEIDGDALLMDFGVEHALIKIGGEDGDVVIPRGEEVCRFHEDAFDAAAAVAGRKS